MAELLRVRNCTNPTRRDDVIFVHGLNGNPREYWFPAGEPEKYWPAWLGEDLPEVGIWSLGYENAAAKPRRFFLARLFLQAGFSMPLVDRADDVLLRLELDGIGKRPLVFISHSMGGLLVKQVLRTANDSTDAKKRAILERTRGVCFIATPHIGADLAESAHYFGSLLGINVSVEELRPHQPHLRNLNKWYRNFVARVGNSIKTLSFFEMKPLPRVGLVVAAGDADPGIPHAGLYPLNEDHNSICKPTSKSSSIYQRTLNFVDMDCLGSFPSSTQPDGAKIVALRQEKGWSQEYLLKEMQILSKDNADQTFIESVRTIARAEEGENTDLRTLVAIARGLGVSVDQILADARESEEALLAERLRTRGHSDEEERKQQWDQVTNYFQEIGERLETMATKLSMDEVPRIAGNALKRLITKEHFYAIVYSVYDTRNPQHREELGSLLDQLQRAAANATALDGTILKGRKLNAAGKRKLAEIERAAGAFQGLAGWMRASRP